MRDATTDSPSPRRCVRSCRGCRPRPARFRRKVSTRTLRTGRYPRRVRSSQASPGYRQPTGCATTSRQARSRSANTGGRNRRSSRGCRRSTPRSGCAPWPTALSGCSCRPESIRRRSPAGSRRWDSTASKASPPRFRVRRSMSRERRGEVPIVWAFPTSPSSSPSASPTIFRVSLPTWTNRSPILPACRPGILRARRRAMSRSSSAATGATNSSAATSATRSTCARAGDATLQSPACGPQPASADVRGSV